MMFPGCRALVFGLLFLVATSSLCNATAGRILRECDNPHESAFMDWEEDGEEEKSESPEHLSVVGWPHSPLEIEFASHRREARAEASTRIVRGSRGPPAV